MIVLREGVEAFLIVAITFAYLRKTLQTHLLQAVVWGIGASVAISGLLGYLFWRSQGANQPLWEGIFGLVTVVLVTSLVIHMWRVGPRLKQEMEGRLEKATAKPTYQASFWGVFLFTAFMISREGMETALLLLQVHEPRLVTGILLGIAAAGFVAYLWEQFGYLINMKHFFRVTAVFLLLFTAQIAVQSFHEFTEAGILPHSEALHVATEPFSTEGIWGRWFSNMSFFGCALWLVGIWFVEKIRGNKPQIAKAG